MFKKFLSGAISGLLVMAMVLTMMPTISASAASGDSSKEAISIEVNKTQSYVYTESASSVRYYKFTAPSNGYFTVTAWTDDSSKYYNYEVFDSSNYELIDKYVREKETSYAMSASKGSQYIMKLSYMSTGASLNFTINFKTDNAWETESNDTASEADVLTNNVYRYGTFNTNDKEDYYKFTLNSTSKVQITCGPKEIGDDITNQVTIYDYQNQNKQIYYANTVKTTTIYLRKGTYYLQVYYGNRNIPYKLKYSATSYSVPKPIIKKVSVGKKYKSFWDNKKYRYLTGIKLKNACDVNGFQVQMAKKKSMKSKVVNTTFELTTYGSDTKAAIHRFDSSYQRRTYYFRVRGYVYDVFGKQIWGSWSSIVKKKF